MDLGLPEDSRIRIRPTNSFTPAEEIKVKDEIERAYKPSFCVVLPPGIDTSEFQATLSDGTVLDENVRDFETQKQLIREFFDDQGIESDTIDKVIDLDKKYHSYIDTNLLRNVTWNLKSFAWENLFSYGRGNKLDFDKLRGVIGVFGRNGVGKTSIFDAINYTLFSRINKDGANKNSQYVNNKCKNAAGKLVLSLSDKEWYVHRTTKNKKTKKGETKASNEVDFRIPKEGKQGNLNGETIVHTNKEIEKILGSLDDLNMISIVPQFGLTGLIDAKKTERKKTYAKFMDLGIFDQKFKLANEDFKEKKALVEEYNKTNFSKEIEDVDEKLKEISNEVRELQLNRTVGENSAEQTAEEILEVKSRIRLIDLEPKEQENPEDVKSEIVRLNEGIAKLNSLIKLRNLGVKTLEEAVGSINIEAAQGRLDSDDESLRQLDKINSSVAQCRKRGQILGTIPGVSACKKCPLVKDAYDSESQIPILENESERLSGRLLTPIEKLELQRAIDSIRELKEERSKLKNLELRLKNATMELGNAEKRLQSIEDKAEAIKKNKELTDYLAELKKDEDLIKHVLKTTNDKLISLTKDQGRLEERKDNLEAKMKEAEKARDEYYIYQLYLSAMGKDGIAYMIMSKKIPIVAKEVNHILSQVSDFRFVIENDEKEKSINYYILSKDGKTTAELAGGAQKTIASIALRAALWKISSLPKPNFLILDEPFGCIDSASYDLMLRFLGYLKNYYDHIFIISHKDELKTSMYSTIHVKRNKKGYSYVEQ